MCPDCTPLQHVVNLDLTLPDHAYLMGLIHSDGHLSAQSRHRGCLSIELAQRDADILHKLQVVIGAGATLSERTRDTNFSTAHSSVSLRVFDRGFREQLISLGVPVGPKSDTITPPSAPFSRIDYLRGYVDGDGSLGMTSHGFPFLSVVTASEPIASLFAGFIFDVTGLRKQCNRNARDEVFNLSVFKEDARSIASALYYGGCLSMDRKRDAAELMYVWERPTGMRKRSRHYLWTKTDDAFILTHGVSESVHSLGRTKASIEMRLWRLKRDAQADLVTPVTVLRPLAVIKA
jgi:hypothetical protein